MSKFRKNSYADISKLYGIIDINDEYISIRKNNKIFKLIIYKIQPVVILNSSKCNMENIIQNYSEFLRSINYDFQIYIENEKININSYFNNIKVGSKKNVVIDIYKKEFESLLLKNNIYITNYYICVTLLENDNELDNIIQSLNQTGVSLEKIVGKEELEKFIYLRLNMETNVC